MGQGRLRTVRGLQEEASNILRDLRDDGVAERPQLCNPTGSLVAGSGGLPLVLWLPKRGGPSGFTHPTGKPIKVSTQRGFSLPDSCSPTTSDSGREFFAYVASDAFPLLQSRAIAVGHNEQSLAELGAKTSCLGADGNNSPFRIVPKFVKVREDICEAQGKVPWHVFQQNVAGSLKA